jgi:hypothetical protein
MVLDVDGYPLFLWVVTEPFRQRPGNKHAIQLKPEIVVKATRPVLLNDETTAR